MSECPDNDHSLRSEILFEDTLKALEESARNLGIEDSDEIIELGPDERIHIKKKRKLKFIKHYIKGELLGHGTFGKVKEVINSVTLERCAMKIMKIKKIMGFPKGTEKVQREMRIMRQLNHENVIRLIDLHYDKEKQKIYIVMEYCVALLQEFLDAAPEKRLPSWQSHRYFCDLIKGLSYLHNHGIIHRDIKPQNLLVDNSDAIKIIDFGVSRELNLYVENDMIHGYEGSPYFHPPEVANHEIFYYSGSKFDIWSAGVTLFNMISGEYLYDCKNLIDYHEKLINREIKYPQIIKDDIQLKELLKGIFRKDFKQRLTIDEILNHPWVIMAHPKIEPHVNIPNLPYGDIYRSITSLPILHNHFYPDPKDKDKPEIEFVTESEYEESLKPKSANIRSNRQSPVRRRGNRRVCVGKRVLLRCVGLRNIIPDHRRRTPQS